MFEQTSNDLTRYIFFLEIEIIIQVWYHLIWVYPPIIYEDGTKKKSMFFNHNGFTRCCYYTLVVSTNDLMFFFSSIA